MFMWSDSKRISHWEKNHHSFEFLKKRNQKVFFKNSIKKVLFQVFLLIFFKKLIIFICIKEVFLLNWILYFSEFFCKKISKIQKKTISKRIEKIFFWDEKFGGRQNLYHFCNKISYLFFRSHAHFSKLVSTGLRSTAILTFFASRSGELIVIKKSLLNIFKTNSFFLKKNFIMSNAFFLKFFLKKKKLFFPKSYLSKQKILAISYNFITKKLKNKKNFSYYFWNKCLKNWSNWRKKFKIFWKHFFPLSSRKRTRDFLFSLF